MALKLFRCFLVFAFLACYTSFILSAPSLLMHWHEWLPYIYGVLPNSKAQKLTTLLISVPASGFMTYGYGFLIPIHKLIFEALTGRDRN